MMEDIFLLKCYIFDKLVNDGNGHFFMFKYVLQQIFYL